MSDSNSSGSSKLHRIARINGYATALISGVLYLAIYGYYYQIPNSWATSVLGALVLLPVSIVLGLFWPVTLLFVGFTSFLDLLNAPGSTPLIYYLFDLIFKSLGMTNW